MIRPRGWGSAPPRLENPAPAKPEPAPDTAGRRRELVAEFIEGATARPQPWQPSPEATKAAADLLLELIEATRAGRDLKPAMTAAGFKRTRAGFKASSATIAGPEFTIAQRLEAGEIREHEAAVTLAALHGVTDRQARNWLRVLRPKARRVNAILDWLKTKSRGLADL